VKDVASTKPVLFIAKDSFPEQMKEEIPGKLMGTV